MASAAFLLAACAGAMKKPEQGIHGTFLTYGPPRDPIDCAPFKTQMEKDECRRWNERVVEEAYQAVIRIRNLHTGEIKETALDATGSYKVALDPGEYEVCVQGECSDPLTVRMNSYIPYGQRLPRRNAGASEPGTAPGDSAKAGP